MVDEPRQLRVAIGLQIAGKLKEAEKIYREILADNPGSADALHLLGLVRAESDDEEAGVKCIESAIQRNPNVAAFHHNLAGVYRRVGRFKEAEIEFRRAIELKRDYSEAYQGLAEMVEFKAGDPLIGEIEKLLIQASPAGSSFLHFAAGKILDDSGDYSAAFEHYRKGNAAADRSFSTKQFRQQIKDTLYCFSPEFVAQKQHQGSTSNQPIFVVGMPRSGTSLIEQVLASHSSVYGAGELNDMKFIVHEAMLKTQSRKPFPNFVPQIKTQQLKAVGQRYLEKTQQPNFQHVVDKHPLNFMYIGLIFLMFPNAKVIHSIRHPLDTCLSCYFQNFTKGQDYSFSLDTLAEFYLDYRRLMSHWHSLFPGKIFDVEYEALLTDQSGVTQGMLDYCELPFEEACLSFHETKRSVKTASFKQVRQPIYQTSRERWRNYESELKGLAQKIGLSSEPLISPITISSFGKIL